MTRTTLLWVSRQPTLQARVPRLAFVRRAVSRFMPGETLAEALAACERFGREGLGAVLTLLGENVADAREAGLVVDHYAGAIEEIARRHLDAEISVKPTHLGLDLGLDVAARSLAALAQAAAGRAGMVWVDMEGSETTQPTIDLFRKVRAAHPNLGLCLQSYLRRTAGDLDLLLADGGSPGIRLVKGAYAEPPRVAFARKSEVDENYATLAGRMLAAAGNGARLVFGTHDPRAIARVCEQASSRGVPKRTFEFHMLYGIGREEQRRLADAGHRVRVLISYGSAWFPWYLRRLAERPANLAFVLRSLVAR
ncbi:MAG TPA: proline dehydrogenase family protein [Candidatus Eisenbacteria bacterium]